MKHKRQRTLFSARLDLCLECGAPVIPSAVQRPGQPIRPALYLPALRAFVCAPCGGLVVEKAA